MKKRFSNVIHKYDYQEKAEIVVKWKEVLKLSTTGGWEDQAFSLVVNKAFFNSPYV